MRQSYQIFMNCGLVSKFVNKTNYKSLYSKARWIWNHKMANSPCSICHEKELEANTQILLSEYRNTIKRIHKYSPFEYQSCLVFRWLLYTNIKANTKILRLFAWSLRWILPYYLPSKLKTKYGEYNFFYWIMTVTWIIPRYLNPISIWHRFQLPLPP